MTESRRVLVVDDEPDITAFGRVSDLVVLNVMLPGLSGYDVLAELRRRPLHNRYTSVMNLGSLRALTRAARSGISLHPNDSPA
jgi:response regulator RpfG family c-di-GMP phosphodiesterase